MIYRGKKLLLDNFRQVLIDYPVDVQDVVRSAILDDVDIIKYLNCDPYKLDQIRLALKSGMDDTYFSVSGAMLYKIRQMCIKGYNISVVEKQLKANTSEEHNNYLIQWVLDGVKVSNLPVELIPKRLLHLYDKGLRSGLDMRKYIPIVDELYISLCIQIEKLGKDVEFLCKDQWDIGVIELFKKYGFLNNTQWGKIRSYISSTDSIDRVSGLLMCIASNIDISVLQKKEKSKYIYEDSCIHQVLDAYENKLDIKEVLKQTTPEGMCALISELKLKKHQKVSGTLVKRSKNRDKGD